jgi:hypothetical protein
MVSDKKDGIMCTFSRIYSRKYLSIFASGYFWGKVVRKYKIDPSDDYYRYDVHYWDDDSAEGIESLHLTRYEECIEMMKKGPPPIGLTDDPPPKGYYKPFIGKTLRELFTMRCKLGGQKCAQCLKLKCGKCSACAYNVKRGFCVGNQCCVRKVSTRTEDIGFAFPFNHSLISFVPPSFRCVLKSK